MSDIYKSYSEVIVKAKGGSRMKELKNIDWMEMGVMAKTKTADILNEGNRTPLRITVTFTNETETYTVDMSKSNARYLIQKLKAAIKLA